MTLKPNGVTPPPREPLAVSVYRTDRMDEVEIEEALQRIEKFSSRQIRAVARIFKPYLIDLGLDVVPEESQFRWHADIVNWPESKQAGAIKVKAMKLAEKIDKVELIERR